MSSVLLRPEKMIVKFRHIVFALLILLAACQKDESLISGKITGRISVLNQAYEPQTDRSDIIVSLFNEADQIGSTITDAEGNYLFENIPYGKYKIDLHNDKYVQGWNNSYIYHVGGYSPTFENYSVYEIPVYQLSLDSVGFFKPEYELIIHLKVDGDTVTSEQAFYYQFIAFAGNTPEVSSTSYISKGKGYLADWDMVNLSLFTKVAVYGRLNSYNFDFNLEQLKQGKIYIRLYPLANGQGYFLSQYSPRALGKPSNVISFVWKDLVGSN
jgi:hypothetical protein